MIEGLTEKLDAIYVKHCSAWNDLGRHLPWLYETAVSYTSPVIIELGVREGVSTSAFLRAVDQVGGHVYSCDISHPKVPMWWADTGLWTLHIGDDMTPEMLDALPDSADVLFIDTSHFEDHTLAELRAYVPRVRPAGLVLLHDTELECPSGYGGRTYPVRHAIETYCAETGLMWENRGGDSGLGIIRIAGE